MRRGRTVEALCRHYRVDTIHAGHVTTLALALFDAVRSRFRIPPSTRRLLAAAARLHDVGFSGDPAHHVEAGARILLREEIAGYSAAQRAFLAAVILLHQKNVARARRHPVFRKAGSLHRVLQLGAILRVADGLDHGHVQNASIRSVRVKRLSVRVRVSTPGYDGNGPWADAKADLWRQVFPGEFRILTRPPSLAPPRFRGIVTPADLTLNAARKLLHLQCRTAIDSARAAAAARTSKPVHDLRVALRRFRAILDTFHKPLADTSAPALRDDLDALLRALGPIRDADVWLDFLSRPSVRTSLATLPGWPAFVKRQRAAQTRHADALRRLLAGPVWKSFVGKASWLLRVELPAIIARAPGDPLPPLAARTLRRAGRRFLRRTRVTETTAPERVHAYRKRCRSVRYVAELCAPALGPAAARLEAILVRLAHDIGEIHDRDVELAAVLRSRSAPARRLARLLLADRRKEWKRFRAGRRELDKAWLRRYLDDTLARRVPSL